MKVLYYGETPVIETGAGQVAKHIIKYLSEFSDNIDVVPINHLGSLEYDTTEYPYTIHTSPLSDLHNKGKMQECIMELNYDVLFLTGDINVLSSFADSIFDASKLKKFALIVYGAIDAELKSSANLDILAMAEYPIVFSEFAYDQVTKHIGHLVGDRLRIIGHGCEPDIFYPLSEEKRRDIRRGFLCNDQTFMVVNVNRNQIRKDLARTMYAFHLFHKIVPNSRLYLHAKQDDLGGNLPAQARNLGLRTWGEYPEIIFAHDGLHETSGISRETLNEIYNMADAFLTTSIGEGWGLTTSEAMAAQIPIIAPRNTTFPELLGHEKRGFLIECGGQELWYMPYGYDSSPRPLASVQQAVDTLYYIYTNPQNAKERAVAAREWSLDHTWSHVEVQWNDLFAQVFGDNK